jgi:hypothetical protein
LAALGRRTAGALGFASCASAAALRSDKSATFSKTAECKTSWRRRKPVPIMAILQKAHRD